GLDRLAARPEALVILGEGEKAALGAEATFPDRVGVTTPHGANSPHKADFGPLAGRRVTVWPDHDEAGARYAESAARLAAEAGAEVRIVRVPADFPEGWDLGDAPPEGWDAARLRALLDAAEPYASTATAPGVQAEANADEAELRRLAGLAPIAYDREREAAAVRLKVRVSTLDAEVAKRRPESGKTRTSLGLVEPAPWPEPVEGAPLLSALADAIAAYVVVPEGAADAMALWSVFAHAHDAFYFSPYLALLSPEKRCGKTTAVGVLARLAPRALPVSSVSGAGLFRAIETEGPTLLIDEVDTMNLRENDGVRAVLNSGHTREAAFTLRCEGDDHRLRRFSTWAPKVFAGIGRLPDTLEDRSIVVRLRRKLPEERVRRFRPNRCGDLRELAER
ncbi:MAG: hypothetical protein K8I02_10125, partial [Candidatus Methylomirabilis sp.]|nr:hypothetical protein [Deltaproteobacteria bacterium]